MAPAPVFARVSNTFRRLRVPLFVAAVVALNISFWHTSETYCHSRDNGSVAIVDSKGERSPLSIDPRDYVGDDPFKLPDEMPEFPKPSRPHVGHRVPSVVHYAFGMRDSPPDFPYWAYLSVRSTIDRLSPDIIYFHYHHEPKGPWWDAILPYITLHHVDHPKTIFGRHVGNYAHAADVIRMYAIAQTGGIYLDIDIFVIKPFDEFLSFSATMGMELYEEPNRSTLDPAGLCNGIIISEPNSPFIRRWLDQYQTFDTDEWSELSVQRPWLLARQTPSEIQVVGHKTFFYPGWVPADIDRIHTRDDYDFYSGEQYAYHAYESQSVGYLDKLTPEVIRQQNTSFTRLVYPLVRSEDDAIQTKWERHQNL